MLDVLTTLAEEGDLEGIRRVLAQGKPVAVDDGRLDEALQVAARLGHLEVVETLLAAGANVNHSDRDGFSPVTSAARAGKWRVVKVLAEHGGDFRTLDGHGKDGYDYLRRCRGKRNRTEIEAVLAQRPAQPARGNRE